MISAASGRAPDLVLFNITELPQFASKGLLRPLDHLVASTSLDLTSLPAQSRPPVTWDVKLCALPLDVHPLAFYENVDMVREAGLDSDKPPKTGHEFLEWAKKLTVRDAAGKVVRYGFELPNTWATRSLDLVQPHLPERRHIPGRQGTGRPRQRGVAQGASVPSRSCKGPWRRRSLGRRQQGRERFASKQVAMKFVGPWEVNLRLARRINFMTAPLPVIGTKPAAWANAHYMTVSKQRSDSNAAADGAFIKRFFDEFAVSATTVGIVPQNKVARESRAFTGTPQY